MEKTVVVVPGPFLHITMNTRVAPEHQAASAILAGANLCLIVVLPEEVSAVGVWESSRVWWLVEAESLIPTMAPLSPLRSFPYGFIRDFIPVVRLLG